MYVIFFILVCVAVTVVVGLTAHAAHKSRGDEETPAADANQSTGSG